MDKDSLALLEMAVIKKALPCAQTGQGEGGSLDMSQRVRFGRQQMCRHGDLLGSSPVSLKTGQAED
jgi:hypothetical protein